MGYSDEVNKIKIDFYTSFAGILLITIGGMIFAGYIIFRVHKDTGAFRIFNFKTIFMSCMSLFIVLIAIYMSRDVGDYLKDINNIRNETYVIDECQVIGQSNAGDPVTFQNRSPKCQSLLSGQEYLLTTFYSPMNVVEVYQVIYLENTKIGRIIKEIE